MSESGETVSLKNSQTHIERLRIARHRLNDHLAAMRVMADRMIGCEPECPNEVGGTCPPSSFNDEVSSLLAGLHDTLALAERQRERITRALMELGADVDDPKRGMAVAVPDPRFQQHLKTLREHQHFPPTPPPQFPMYPPGMDTRPIGPRL